MFKPFHLKKNYFLTSVILFFSVGVLFFTFSCKNSNTENNTTFFGGKIKNPKSEYIYFSKNEKIIDSAKIDQNNRFLFKLDSLNAGLYTFKHGPEFQYLYLEPKDSLLIYLNTWDFDESLIFSGKGGAKNNFLINLYLQQEKNEKKFKYYYRLNEEEFSKKVDEEIEKLMLQYNELINAENEEPSELFKKISKTGIYFPFYYFKEYYPFNYKKALKLKQLPTLSDEFYSFRKNINLNDESLISYGPYLAYIGTYLHHTAYTVKINNPEKNIIGLNFMEIVNDKIKIKSLKNNLLSKSLWNSLTDETLSDIECQKIQDYFFKHCTDEKLISEIKKSIKQKEQFKQGDTLPKILAINANGDKVTINNITKNNNTVIYFWPKDMAQIEMLNSKLKHFQKEFPDVLFIGVERNKSTEEWKSFIKTKKLPKNTQFKLDKNCNIYSWFEGDMARTLVIDYQGVVKNSYLFFNDSYSLEKKLHQLKKQ